jgi:hypothetical protein
MVLPAEEPYHEHPLPASVEPLWPPTASKTSWPPPQPLRDGVQLAEFGRIVAGVPMKMETPPPQVPLDIPGSASEAPEN